MKLTPGKLAGLQRVSDKRGVIAAAAMDQRGSLQKSLAKEKGGDISDAMMEGDHPALDRRPRREPVVPHPWRRLRSARDVGLAGPAATSLARCRHRRRAGGVPLRPS